MSAYGHVCAGKQTIEFEVPDNYNPVRHQIEMLQRTRARNERVQRPGAEDQGRNQQIAMFGNGMSDDLHYEASPDETAAYKQVALDLLYNIGCQYDIKTNDMQQLCELACIPSLICKSIRVSVHPLRTVFF